MNRKKRYIYIGASLFSAGSSHPSKDHRVDLHIQMTECSLSGVATSFGKKRVATKSLLNGV